MEAGSPLSQVKALTFDVFGTVVDWRFSVEEALGREAANKIQSASFAALPSEVQGRAKSLTADDWAAFAQEWRNSYGRFTLGFQPGVTPWKDVDTHHRDSLLELLDKWGVPGLYDADEVERLSKIWHFLRPWPDSSEGIHKLGTKLVTATLSNGNQSLLKDLNQFGDLGFQRILSAEDFQAYKPNPATYLGACKALGLEPSQVAMVAAHLGDLLSARSYGLRTIYVERPREEAKNDPEVERYRADNSTIDLWVNGDEEGFVEVARRLGI
ncbi:haloacid dehalogenase [Thozetella sp. PMI_491]|nr:haloacid dehalogenase [Thozetella sp. PMI_491]